MLSIRPTVAEHAFHLYGRSIHPELFSIHRRRVIERKLYSAKIEITSDGHLLTFTNRSTVLTEVVCSALQLLPEKRKLLSSRLNGKCVEEVNGKRGVGYHTQFELEHVSSDMFWMVHNQLQYCRLENQLVQKFNSSGRIPFGAVSFVHIEERERQLLVQAFHTFPDDFTIVKSVSTFTAGK